MSSKILLRRGTAAQWSSANPILGTGELGIETDTLKIKIGNGTSTWTQLTSYANVTPSQLTSEINSLINAAPSTLDTLNELAAAINNDASFSTTVNNLLTGKVSKSGGDTITTSTASTKGLIIKAAASQSVNLLEFQNSIGSPITYFNSNGGLTATEGVISTLYSGGYLTTGTLGYYNATTFAPSVIPIVVRGAVSQTADLTQWQNSAGTVLARVSSDGKLVVANDGETPSSLMLTSLAAPLITTTSNASSYGLTISGTNAGVNSNVGMAFSAWGGLGFNGVAVPGAGIWFTRTGGYSQGYLSFLTRTGITQASPLAERMRVGETGTITVAGFTAASIGLIVKGAASQTANLQEWQNSAGTVIAKVDSVGKIGIGAGTTALSYGLDVFTGSARIWNGITGAGQTGTLYLGDGSLTKSYGSGWELYGALVTTGGYGISSNANLDAGGTTLGYGRLSVNTGATTTVGAVIRGAASQTANLQEWQDSTGTVLSNITYFGGARLYDLGIKGSPAGIGWAYFGNDNTSTKNVVVRGFASQTANLQEWQDSAGTALSYIKPDGSLYFTANSNAVLISGTSTSGLNRIISNGNDFSFSPYFDGLFAPANSAGRWRPANDATSDLGTSGQRWKDLYATSGILTNNSTSKVGLIVKAVASQTADLQQWQNSDGIVQSRMTDIGKLFSNYLQSSYGILTGNATYAGGYNFISNPSFATTDVSLIVKAVSSQTANLQEWQDSAGTVLVSVLSNGRTTIRSNGADYGAALSVGTNSTTAVGLTVRGVTSQTANLQEWQNSAGSVVSSISNAGLATFSNVGVTNNINAYYGKISANTQALGYLGQLSTVTANASTIGLVVRGFTSQTANLTEWQDSTGYLISRVDSGGSHWINAAPATSDSVETSSAYLYLTSNRWTGSASSAEVFGINSFRFGGAGAVGAFALHLKPSSSANAYLSIAGDSSRSVGVNVQYPSASSGYGQFGVQIQDASYKGVVVKAATSQTANLQEWQNSGGTVLANIASNGDFSIPFGGSTGGAQFSRISGIYGSLTLRSSTLANSANTSALIGTGYAGGIGLIVKGAASQTANLQEWQNSSGSLVGYISPAGSAIWYGSSIVSGDLRVGTATYFGSALSVYARAATEIGTVVRGFASQTADLQQWQDNSGTSVLKIGADGSVRGNGTFGAWGGAYSQFDTNGNPTFKYLMGYNVTAGGYYTEPSEVKLTVRAANLQTADLQQWQNSSGAVLAEITVSGSLELNGKDIELMNIMGAF